MIEVLSDRFVCKCKGYVFEYDAVRGFGFIQLVSKLVEKPTANGSSTEWDNEGRVLQQVFAHYKDIKMEGYKKLLIDQTVMFDMHLKSVIKNGAKTSQYYAKEIVVTGCKDDENGGVDGNC